MSIQPFTGIHASWSPDGMSIAYLQPNVVGSIDMLRVMNLETGRIQDITRGGYFPQWSADSTRLLCAWYGGRMCIFDVDKYREDWDSRLDFVKDNSPGWNKFVWSPDNQEDCLHHGVSEAY